MKKKKERKKRGRKEEGSDDDNCYAYTAKERGRGDEGLFVVRPTASRLPGVGVRPAG